MLTIVNVFIFPEAQGLFMGSVITAQITGFILVTLPVSLYFIISDSTIGKQSLGKRKVGIQVVRQDGNAVSVLHLTFRTIIKFLPWELSHYLVYRLVYLGDVSVPISYYVVGGFIYLLIFIYILTTVFTSMKQSLYDIIAKTYVIKVR